MYKRVLKAAVCFIVVSSIVVSLIVGLVNIEVIKRSGATKVNNNSYSSYNNNSSSVEYKSKLGYSYYIDNVSNSSVLLLESKVSNNNNKYWILKLDNGKVRVVSSYKDIE